MHFEGGQALAQALRTLPDRVSRRVVKEALTDGAEPIRARMEANAHHGNVAPHIAENMVIGTARRSDTPDGTGVAVGPRKGQFFYGYFLEFGTRKMSARPFARPAFDGEAQGALTIIGRALWTALAGRGIGRTVRDTSGPISAGPGGRIGL